MLEAFDAVNVFNDGLDESVDVMKAAEEEAARLAKILKDKLGVGFGGGPVLGAGAKGADLGNIFAGPGADEGIGFFGEGMGVAESSIARLLASIRRRGQRTRQQIADDLKKEQTIRDALNEAAKVNFNLILAQRDARRQELEILQEALRIEQERLRIQTQATAMSSRNANLIAAQAGLGPEGGGGISSFRRQRARIAVLDDAGNLIGTREGGVFSPTQGAIARHEQGIINLDAVVNLDGAAVGSAQGHSVQDGG